MEKEIISVMVATLDESRIDSRHRDNEIWEETHENGAHYEVAKHSLSTPEGDMLEFVSMVVTGTQSQRIRVIGDFCQVFGDAQSIVPVEGYCGSKEFAVWTINYED